MSPTESGILLPWGSLSRPDRKSCAGHTLAQSAFPQKISLQTTELLD